jgi:LmbE family N-acetylglucosaminyl deacetylase
MCADFLPSRKRAAAVCVPDGKPLADALRRITHLGIGAHQDDLEIMAYHGIAACFGDEARWFGGIICTDGAGSPRAGGFAGYSDAQMKDQRRREQEEAARIGEYGVMAQLGYPSAAVKGSERSSLEDDLVALLERACPEVVYTHSPADRHETHVAVALASLRALRRLPDDARPRAVYGCEGWGSLDWLDDDDAVVLDVGAHPELAERLVAVFASQIAGGKRYDLAAAGRRRANATFRASHDVDVLEQAWLAMDLTPLLGEGAPDVETFVGARIERFAAGVKDRLQRYRETRPRVR